MPFVERRDANGMKVTRILLSDRHGRMVEVQVGDVVRVLKRSGSEKVGCHGIVDGFTPERVRVVIDGAVSFFRDINLVFVESGKMRSSSGIGAPAATVTTGTVVERASGLDDNNGLSNLEVSAVEKARREFEVLHLECEHAVQVSIRTSVDLDVLMDRAGMRNVGERERDKLREFKRVVMDDAERRMVGFKEFVTSVSEGMLAELNKEE